jgi:hypothetical protein
MEAAESALLLARLFRREGELRRFSEPLLGACPQEKLYAERLLELGILHPRIGQLIFQSRATIAVEQGG